jgi:hypothetical protein
MRLTERHWVLTGWWLFVACAVFFIASAWRAGDPLALIGSLCFMAANVAFLVPLYRRAHHEQHAERAREE